MKKKTIKLLGKKVAICYNMATQIAYEEITGNTFDVADLNKTSNAMALYLACIFANNPETDITLDDLLKDATANEIKTLQNAVLDSFKEWCGVADKEQKEEDAEKKA